MHIFCADYKDSADGGTVYGRGILVDGRSSSGAHGSGHVCCQVLLVQVIVRMVFQV